MSPRVGRGWVRVEASVYPSMRTAGPGNPGWASGRDETVLARGCWRGRELPAELRFGGHSFREHLRERPRRASWDTGWGEAEVAGPHLGLDPACERGRA